MSEKYNKPSTLLAISILALAASLVYLTFELSRFIRQVPDILENIRTTSEKVEPVLEEVSQLRDLIPPILDEVRATRKQIPAILDEIKHVREAIPPILTEVDKTREQLPVVLDEVAAVRGQLPSVLASVDSVSTEMKAYRPIASDALIQLSEVRKEVPVTLDRVDGLIASAGVAAGEASSGVLTGAISGLITAPFKIVGSFASSILKMSEDEAHNYTEEDLLLVKEHGQSLLAKGKLNDSHKWENKDTGKNFKVSLNKIYSKDSLACRDLLLQAWSESKLTVNKVVSVCMNDEGEWEHH